MSDPSIHERSHQHYQHYHQQQAPPPQQQQQLITGPGLRSFMSSNAEEEEEEAEEESEQEQDQAHRGPVQSYEYKPLQADSYTFVDTTNDPSEASFALENVLLRPPAP